MRIRNKDFPKGTHPTKKGPGITHHQGKMERDLLLTPEARRESYTDHFGDGVKKASRTMPSSWSGR